DGIFRDAEIWINGFYLGNNKSGYLGIYFDITDFINYSGNNTIVVRVDATQFEGWFYEGAGIYRHVWLNSFHPCHISPDGVFAFANINNKNALLEVETNLKNDNNTSGNYVINTYLVNRLGNTVAKAKEQPVFMKVLEENIVKQKITIDNPILWSLDNPYLYRIVVELKENGKVIDQIKLRFGFRKIEIKPNGVFLNGKHVKILGANNHQDHAGIGTALPDYMQFYRIGLLKQMGVNAYRASHHAPTLELLDACDSLGMLVMSEQRLLSSSAEYIDQLTRLIKRDRSRTSVFMWSIGNEEGFIQANQYGKRIAQTLLKKIKQLDSTRTSTYAADLPNVFKGVNEVIPVRGFNYRQFAVEDYHRNHPNQPIIGTEMGSTVTTRGEYRKDSIRGYLPDQDITAPWWASKAEEWWKLAASNDYWLGGFIWTGFDYRGEPTPYKWPNINSHFGVMDVCGFPKNIYYYYQSWWTDKDVLHISPHWNWPQYLNSPIEVWVNSNADSVELFLNNKSLGTKVMERNSHLTWLVNYQPGILKAIGYKKGRLITAKQETTGNPVDVVVTPYKTTLLADGKDVSVINISMQDAEGRDIPNANNQIRFSISGPGKIIGVGNGDPSSHEPDKCADGMWQRSLFNGKCQVIVQSTGEAGLIKFEAHANGVWSGGTDIITVKPANVEMVNNEEKFPLTVAMKKTLTVPKMLGADISFLPELEAKGVLFSDKGKQNDAIAILKEHGFNYVRLRIFNEPANDSGYSPKNGFCDLNNTLKMAKRIKAAGLQLLLDFHYSDTWADPGKQFKPKAWEKHSFDSLQILVFNYTKTVLEALKAQNT
ncbi:MAG: beta-galactosidase GalA, partial [Chitinophagaceae bacterium]